MKLNFIETRLGEPITSLDSFKEYIAFGSITGFFGIFNTENNKITYSKICQEELVRQLKIVKNHLFVIIGDEKVLKCRIPSLEVEKTIHYKTYIHNESLCSNMIPFLKF